MASTILGANYDTQIRERLGVSIDDLPTVNIDRVIPAVEAKLKRRIPTYESLTGDDLTFWQAAALAAIAEKCCSILKSMMSKSEKTPFYSNEAAQDWDKLEQELGDEKEEYLSLITGYTYSTTIFAAAGPTRDGAYSE